MSENPEHPTEKITTGPSRYDQIKARVRTILNASQDRDRTTLLIQSFLAVVILTNTIAVVVSTIPDFPLQFLVLSVIVVCLSIFSIEYILRLWSCTHSGTVRGRAIDRLRYAIQISMIIDLISIIPILFFYLFPRIPALLHLFMLLSIFKLVRYSRDSESLKQLRRVIFKKREIGRAHV